MNITTERELSLRAAPVFYFPHFVLKGYLPFIFQKIIATIQICSAGFRPKRTVLVIGRMFGEG